MLVQRLEWRALTWAEVEDWAGLRSVERGREYCRAGNVLRLSVTADGDLAGWVRGGQRYACRIHLNKAIRSRCTCPLTDPGCKHAVAVLLAYLDALRHGRDVAPADEDDPFWPIPEFDEQSAPPALADDAEQLRQQIAEALVWPVPSACESVLPHLRKLRSLLGQSGRQREWDEYEAELRSTHQRRWRLHEVLDRLHTRRVIPA
jgi:uncharacterized Zn finger protein